METQFLMDGKGNKTAVLMSIKKYNQMMEELDNLEDVRLFDEAKKEDDSARISLEDYIKSRENKRNGIL